MGVAGSTSPVPSSSYFKCHPPCDFLLLGKVYKDGLVLSSLKTDPPLPKEC